MAPNNAPVDVAIAINPNDLDAVPRLVEEINEGVKSLATGGHEARHEMIVKARSLMLALEAPRETMIKHCWAQVRQIPTESGLAKYLQVVAFRRAPWLASTLESTPDSGRIWPKRVTSLRRLLTSLGTWALIRPYLVSTISFNIISRCSDGWIMATNSCIIRPPSTSPECHGLHHRDRHGRVPANKLHQVPEHPDHLGWLSCDVRHLLHPRASSSLAPAKLPA